MCFIAALAVLEKLKKLLLFSNNYQIRKIIVLDFNRLEKVSGTPNWAKLQSEREKDSEGLYDFDNW